MSNVRVIPSQEYIYDSEGIPLHFCQAYTTEIARKYNGDVIAVIERKCLRSARATLGVFVDNVTGNLLMVPTCSKHHDMQDVPPHE